MRTYVCPKCGKVDKQPIRCEVWHRCPAVKAGNQMRQFNEVQEDER